MAAEKNRPNEIHINRVYDAPLAAVWDAWTDPAQVAQWWGPRGFTITTHSKDLRTGGHWNYTMHGPDGVNYPNSTKYLLVEKHSKLVYDHGGNVDRPPLFRVTVTFAESKGKTTMAMTMTLPTPQAAEEARAFIKKAGGNATWDRLAEFLTRNSSNEEVFVINRTFNAPLETMFDMWTIPDHFSKWLAPTGFTMKFSHADIRTGGSTAYSMTGNGITMYGRAQYHEVQKPHRIVYTQQFTDEQGNLSRHPKVPTFPATLLTTVTLSPEGPDQTRVTVTWQPVAPFTAEELATFVQAKPGMTLGWTGSFDKLEDLLG